MPTESQSVYGPGGAFLIGVGLIAYAVFSKPVADFDTRWLVFLIGIMMFAQSAFLLKHKYGLGLSADGAAMYDAFTLAIMFGIFAVACFAGATVFGPGLQGGIGLLPHSVNNAIGRALFGLFGIGMTWLTLGRCVDFFKAFIRWSRARRTP